MEIGALGHPGYVLVIKNKVKETASILLQEMVANLVQDFQRKQMKGTLNFVKVKIV